MEKIKSIFYRIILLIGILIYFYPNISDYVNDLNQSKSIIEYNKAIDEFDPIKIKEILKKAHEYNEKLRGLDYPFTKRKTLGEYDKILDPFDTGMMGHVSIEKININLPIYHGAHEGVIQRAVGHLPGSSFPVGGKSTHAVITSHCGLPTSRLFTDLIQLEIGDEFSLSLLGEKLIYRIDQIKTILPHEIESLNIIEGKDYVTMFTCTPYGINTHRLLVRGERVLREDKESLNSQQEVIENLKSNAIMAIIIILIILIIMISIIWDIIKVLIKRKEKKSSR